MAVVASKTKKVSTEKKVTASHPPYAEMIKEAIVALKERTGSSQIAIAKFIDDKHAKTLPANYKKLLLSQLKRLVSSGTLVKIKHSFKLGATAKPASTKPKTTVTKSKTAVKPKAKVVGSTPVKAKKVAVKAKKATPKKAVKAKKVVPKAGTPAVLKAKKAVLKTKVAKPKSVKSPVKKAAVKKAKK